MTYTSPLPALTSPLGTGKIKLEDGTEFSISLSSSVSQSMLQLSSLEAFPSYIYQSTTIETKKKIENGVLYIYICVCVSSECKANSPSLDISKDAKLSIEE